MAKLVLTDTVTGYQQPDTVNGNNAAIIAAVENSLSRYPVPAGTSNQMGTTLDMDSQKIINLAPPTDPADAARLTDLQHVSAIIGTTVPPQAGAAGQQLGTDGANLVFQQVIPLQAGNAGKQLQTDGAALSWQALIPSQASNANKFLQTNGTVTSWQLALPDQTSQAGKILTTNGSAASWTANLTRPTFAAIKQTAQNMSSTTLTPDNTLVVTVTAAGWYYFDGLFVLSTANSGNGFKYQFAGTATVGSMSWAAQGTNNSAVTMNNYGSIGSVATHTAISLSLDIQVLTGFVNITNAGTFLLNWAQNASVSGATTLGAGSSIQLTQFA